MYSIFKIFLFIVSFSLCISSANAKLFDASEFYLSNGMRVIVIPNHKAPIIKHMVWYNSGAVDEAVGKGGSAHLLEHLMFRGTKQVKGHEFNNILEKNGADSNAFTSLDYTAYHQSLDISKLELAMALEADRMQNLNITPQDFALERDIVFQERMQVVENNPSSQFGESYRRLLWQEHPYGRPVTGTSEEIMNLTIEDVKDYYQHFYAPNNAILILSGDIDLRTAQTLAKKHYGIIPKRELGKRAQFPVLKQGMKAELKMSLPQINAPRITKSYIAPSYNTNKDNLYNLSVFSKYLGEGDTSELYKSLVLDKKLALGISSGYDYTDRSYGTFSISAVPADGVSPELLNQAIDEELKKAINALNIENINKTKHKMLAGLVYLKDNPFEAASIVGTMASIGMPLDEIEQHADKIRLVKYQGVKKSAQELFENASVVTGVLIPQKGEQ